MDENNNSIENGIRLQDGRIIQGYPKQDPVVEEDKETPIFDTTGEYFSIPKKPQKPKLTDERRVGVEEAIYGQCFPYLGQP